MANFTSNVSFGPEYDADALAISRRRKLAEALSAQGMDPIAMPQTPAGGFTPHVSPFQGLAKMAQAYAGALGERRADTEQKALAGQMQQRRSADMSALVGALGGRPASPGGLYEDASGNVTQADPMGAQTPQQSIAQVMPMIQDPGMQQTGMQLLAEYNKPFTLNQGDRRIGPGGVPIAEAPKRKPPEVIHDYGVLVKNEPHVQPHVVTYGDSGEVLGAQPLPGSVPTPKFARQTQPPTPQPVTTTTVMIDGQPYMVDARTFDHRLGLRSPGVIGPANKPNSTQLPGPALREQNEHLEAIGLAGNITNDLNAVLGQLEPTQGVRGQNPPQLELGMVNNAISSVRNYIGQSNDNSRNYATLKATLIKLQNDSLRLNKGVQTEGDAVRAWNELLANINDQEFVKKRLQEIININERAVRQRRMSIDSVRRNYGLDPYDSSGMANQGSTVVPNAYQGPERRNNVTDFADMGRGRR